MAPVQRAGTEYEFDIVADMDIDHRLIVSKSRCFAVADLVVSKPKGDWMQPVIAWLTSGEAVVREPQQEQAAQTAATEPAPHWIKDSESRRRFWAWTGDLGLTKAEVHAALGVEHVEEFNGSKSDAVAVINAYIEAHVDEGQEG